MALHLSFSARLAAESDNLAVSFNIEVFRLRFSVKRTHKQSSTHSGNVTLAANLLLLLVLLRWVILAFGGRAGAGANVCVATTPTAIGTIKIPYSLALLAYAI